jgi:hypothetical protein
MRTAARVSLIAIVGAVCVGCHTDGECTRRALEGGKVPSKVEDIVEEIDAGSVQGDLCELWERLALGLDPAVVELREGAERVGDFQWTILFRPGVLHCPRAGVCTVPRIGDIDIAVKSGEPRLDVANVVLTPNRIGPLLADDRVRYIAPTCAGSAKTSSLQALSKVATDEAVLPMIRGGSPMLRDPERKCEPRDANKQWNVEDACIPPAAQEDRASSIVAVVDSGLNCLDPAIHERIDGGKQPEPPRHCTWNSGKNYLYPDVPPDHCGNAQHPGCSMHGTQVAGVLASNKLDLPGVDPSADLLSMRVLEADGDLVEPSTTVATAILESGGRQRRIINISATWYMDYPWIAAAVDAVTADGKHLVVAAARKAPDRIAYPSAYTGCNDAVIGVSGIGRQLGDPADTTVAQWVRYGWGQLSARDAAYMVAPGVNIRLLDGTSDTGGLKDNGSSFAAPLVSGAASLVWSSNEFESCSAAGVREALECSARITIVGKGYPRKRLHLGCLFGQRDLPICRGARRCIDSVKEQFCR